MAGGVDPSVARFVARHEDLFVMAMRLATRPPLRWLAPQLAPAFAAADVELAIAAMRPDVLPVLKAVLESFGPMMTEDARGRLAAIVALFGSPPSSPAAAEALDRLRPDLALAGSAEPAPLHLVSPPAPGRDASTPRRREDHAAEDTP